MTLRNELLKAVALTKTGLLSCKGMPFNPAARPLSSLIRLMLRLSTGNSVQTTAAVSLQSMNPRFAAYSKGGKAQARDNDRFA